MPSTLINPSVKALCEQHGIDPATIAGSGENGTILKTDVQTAIARRSQKASGAVSVALEPRHREWLSRAAANAGRTTEKHLEWIVRQAYAADPTKAGAVDPMAGSGLARDFNAVTGSYV